jgi:hypothetical protein
LVTALALRLVLWARAYGFEQGDPVEYVNIAYKIAFGIGIPWWDLRPLLLSLLYVPVLYAGQLWPDPSGEAMVRLLRLVGVLFSIGAVWLVYLLGRRLGGELVGLVSGLLVAVNAEFNRVSVSTFAEVPSTFFVLLALWCLIERTPRRSFLAGLALGAACMIRYQAIAFVAPIGLWTLACARRTESQSSVLRFAVGLGLAALAQAAIEVVAYGRPFHSLLVSFEYNVTSGLAPIEFGSEPFEWYGTRAPEWFGVVPLALALLGVPALGRGPQSASWRLVGLAAVTMSLVLSALPHKELRFMAQVVPLLALFAGAGLARVVTWLGQWHGFRSEKAPRAIRGALVLAAVGPLLWASLRLDLAANVAYVDGPKRAAEIKPGGILGTIPWFVPRPYTGTRLTLERMDRKVWDDRDRVTSAIEQSDFLLFPEYWLLEDRYVRRLVDAGFRTLESYENGVVLLQSKRLDEPTRRRPRN